jgi:hypothetical protein
MNPDLPCGFPIDTGSSVEQVWYEGSIHLFQGSLGGEKVQWLKSLGSETEELVWIPAVPLSACVILGNLLVS